MVDIKEFSKTRFLNNVLAGIKAESANGFESSIDGDLANAVAPAECGCPDCEAAVSPLAYLADLLNYALENITDGGESGFSYFPN